MNALVYFFALIAVVLCRPQETYDKKYDDFNAQDLAENVRLLKSYGKCFLDKGPCTAEGSDFKKMIPEALRTTCGKCTPKQQELIRTVVHAFQEKLPDVWADLIKKEDPSGQYQKSFDAFLKGTSQ